MYAEEPYLVSSQIPNAASELYQYVQAGLSCSHVKPD